MIHNLVKINTHEDKQSYLDKLIYLKLRLESNKDLFDLDWYSYCSSLCVISFPNEGTAQLEFIESINPGHGDGTLLVAAVTKELLNKKLKRFVISDGLPSIFYEFFENMGFHKVDGKLLLTLNR